MSVIVTAQATRIDLEMLRDKATRLRIDLVLSTTAAGSGHPTSCASAAEIMAVLFYSTVLIGRRNGPSYMRIGRPAAPILYGPDERFEVGKCKVLRSSDLDMAVVVAAGITVSEALSAYGQQIRYFTAPWGMALEILHRPDHMPYEKETQSRLFGPLPSWELTTSEI
jgi:transketolase